MLVDHVFKPDEAWKSFGHIWSCSCRNNFPQNVKEYKY